ncbi:unnamed protein product [Soboliphyme baturini]|uniref:Uncharacterized protein n=1 Tax=Soboliphyme baturini TaxID=241478 RepID=A0A3P7ZG73_9BILA|nr:unnamed protein product [Soboliphyme baturini]
MFSLLNVSSQCDFAFTSCEVDPDQHTYKEKGLYGPAVGHYLGVLKCCPEKRASLEREFLKVFKEFYARHEDAMDYLITASELYPDSVLFTTFLANSLFRYGLYEEAALCFMKALSIDSSYPSLKECLMNLRGYFVDQWHFRMLNDCQRNLAYKTALEHRLAAMPIDAVVLDIGCGSGILSLLAVKAGAHKVCGCDHSLMMCQMARKIVALNGKEAADRIHIIEKNSMFLKLDEDIDQQVDLVVTELMDAGFYGESIAPTLLDAKRRLLKPSGRIIPCRAKIWAILIEAPHIRTCHVLKPKTFFDSVKHSLDEEPYTAEMLCKLKHGFRVLSVATLIDEVDLEDISDLEARVVQGVSREVNFEVINSGRLDAIVCWFTALLADGCSAQVCSSYDSDSSWEQAVFPVLNERKLCVGEKVPLDVTIKGSWFQCSPQEEQQPLDSSGACRVFKPLTANDTWLIAMLNDDILTNTYRLFFERSKQGTMFRAALDISNNPLISFLTSSVLQIPVVARLEPPSQAVWRVIANESDTATVERITLDILDKKIEEHKDLDLLVCCPIESTGLLQSKILEHVAYFRTVLNIAHVIPNSIEVYGLLVESHELAGYTHVVDDKNTADLGIGKVMNDFRTLIQEDIEFTTLSYTAFSAEFKIMSIDLEEDSLSPSCETLPHFLRQMTKLNVPVTRDGFVNALVFWFTLLSPNHGSVSLRTADQLTHFKVAAAVFDPIEVEKNQMCNVCAELSTSTLEFTVV